MILKLGHVPYSTFMRWKRRFEREEPVIRKRGPKKVAPLELEALEAKIRTLSHRKKRTRDTGALYETFKDGISRRDFLEMVKIAREEAKREAALEQRRIEWKQPGQVWAMDDTRYGRDEKGKKLYIHNLQDLSSRYKLGPLAGEFAHGPEVASNLKKHFDQYGPPLFLKRDNGGNLNHAEVEKVLSEYMVIPLNSPTYYPPYNGAIEKAQQEVKEKIKEKGAHLDVVPKEHFKPCTESACHDLNHIHRRCLKGRTSCQVFFEKKGGARYTKRKRRAIFEWIKERSCAIMEKLGDWSTKAFQLAWRIAAETWLRNNGFISVTYRGRVLPSFL